MGCGESKHSVGTTDSFSTRKKSKSGSNNSSRKAQNSEVPHDKQATEIEDNTISNTTLKNGERQEIGLNGIQDESATKQVEKNTVATDTPIKNNLILESSKLEKEDDKKKQIESSYSSINPTRENEGQHNKLATEGEDENLVEEDIATTNNTKAQKEDGTNEVTNEVNDQNGSIDMEKTSENVVEDVGASQETKQNIVETKLEVINEVLENETEASEDNVDAKQELEEKVAEANPEERQEVETKSEIINQENVVENPEIEQNIVETKLEVEEEVENKPEVEQENSDTNPEIEQNDTETRSEVMEEDVEDKPEIEQENTESNPNTEQKGVETEPEVVQEDVENKSESQEKNDDESFETNEENVETTLEAKNEVDETITSETGMQNE